MRMCVCVNRISSCSRQSGLLHHHTFSSTYDGLAPLCIALAAEIESDVQNDISLTCLLLDIVSDLLTYSTDCSRFEGIDVFKSA